ncbi:SLC13 family permease, partial [Bacillus thuringiensis]
LLPIILFPLTGALQAGDVTSAYGDSTIFLFMGGFIIAIAMEKWNLHKRIAMNIILLIGTGTERIVLGFMLATGFLSMWISNTATAMMMLPIGTAVIYQVNESLKREGTNRT